MHLFRPGFMRFVDPCWSGLAVTSAVLLAGAAHQVNGAAVNARSPALADVSTAIALAKDGDTVTVPAGTAHWTNQLSISKGVILSGATTVTAAGTKTPTVSDLTVIINDATGGPNLVDVKLTAAQHFQLTGFTFRAGLSAGSLIHLAGSGNTPVMSCRVDHCHLVGSTNRSVQTDGWLYGVADHAISSRPRLTGNLFTSTRRPTAASCSAMAAGPIIPGSEQRGSSLSRTTR